MAVAGGSTTTAATALSSPLPSPPSHCHSSVGLSFLFTFVGFIGIVMLVYVFFLMIIKCPPNPFVRRRRPITGAIPTTISPSRNKIGDNLLELVSDLKFNKEDDGIEYGSECPVCLSVFVYGEDVRQLKACKHVFHGACIDMWLHSHSSCPVCRGSVPVKRSPVTVGRERDDDYRQGLPDSSSLV